MAEASFTVSLAISPAGFRAERKMLRAARLLDLPEGSRRWRRWNRVVARNVAAFEREVALGQRGPSSFVIRASSFNLGGAR